MAKTRNPKKQQVVTLADVGRAAGVSAVAVSTVLNGARSSTRVSPATRQRILDQAGIMRYRPNAAARALVVQRMHTVGIAAVVDGSEPNHYFIEVFNGVLTAVASLGYYATVFAVHNWATESELLHGFSAGRVDGLLLIAPLLDAAAARDLPEHLPTVAMHANHKLPGIVNLECEDEQGAFDMVRYLISQGHRRILHLCGRRGLLGPERRIQGYKRALAEAGITFEESNIVETDFSVQCARLAMQSWLQRSVGRPLPQAIFCVNDRAALGCLEILAECGIQVPEEVSVAGFDDTIIARTTVPQLTTVRQPLRAMAERAVEILIRKIQDRKDPDIRATANTIVFPTEVIVRASVGPAPKASRPIPPLPLSRS